ALMRYETFSYTIYTQYTSAVDRTYAAWLALMLLAMTLSIVLFEARLLGRRRYARVGGGVARSTPATKLGARAPLAWTWVALVLGATLGLPILALGAWMVLAPTGYTTLAVRVFSRTNEGMLAEAAPFAAAVVLFSAAFAGLLLSYEGRR
ncbi:MAG: iron ABC transporter permease, partial [Trueperaceae bacterium]